MGGYWFPTSRNPGRHVRNRYGTDIYKHAEHWMTLGKYRTFLDPNQLVLTHSFPRQTRWLAALPSDGHV